MWFDKKTFQFGLFVLCTYPFISHAADMFGNPTEIGTSGKIEIQIGGGRSSDLALDSNITTGTLKIGTVSGTQSIPASTFSLSEDQAFIGVSYALNPRSQLIANLGTGKNSGQQSSSYSIGLKISPDAGVSLIKMGLMLRAQQVKTDISGPYTLIPPYNNINDSTNSYAVQTDIKGTEQIKYVRLDAFFGASASSGVIRPYGGVSLTHISGTDTLSMNDMALIYTSPIGGGVASQSNQQVTFNAKTDISASRYFTGIFGLSVNPESDLGMTAELQYGVQRSFMLSGCIRF